MASCLVKRVAALRSKATSPLLLHLRRLYCPGALMFCIQDKASSVASTLRLSPVFSGFNEVGSKCSRFEVIDDETWHLLSGFSCADRGNVKDKALDSWSGFDDEGNNDAGKCLSSDGATPLYDEIEDMRVRGNLFYKMDKDSIEYGECKYDFHKKKHSTNGKKGNDTGDIWMKGKSIQSEYGIQETTRGRGSKPAASPACHKIENTSTLPVGVRKEITAGRGSKPTASLSFHNTLNTLTSPVPVRSSGRAPTFNQLTAAYHEPFCLDIYVSKASVRASIIHRATSKVVVVAHSISKDMKLDLKSARNKDACIAVGQVLAKRALEDDIHNAVFIPRKGDKLEGKLMIVLESVRRGGIDVKLKLKQKNAR